MGRVRRGLVHSLPYPSRSTAFSSLVTHPGSRCSPHHFLLHLTSSGPFLISLRPAGAPLRGTRWKGYEVSVGNRDSEVNGESRTVPFSRHSLAPSGSTSRGSFMTGGHESNEGTTDMTREPAR